MPPSDGPADRRFYLGLISGTSADGIDAALAQFHDTQPPRTLAARTFAWPQALRAEILALSQSGAGIELDRAARLDQRVGAAFAQAARDLLEIAGIAASAVAAIGSHGQTLRHDPTGAAPFSWQIGDPHLIAERTSITTVADFRRRDIAAGGQGAPLMPAFHRAMLPPATHDRAVLNLGGIANLTLLPHTGVVRGFDTGPANGLMDAWIQARTGVAYDVNGRLAASGRVDAVLLDRLLADPYFALPPPKSTGRDHFHLGWLQHRLHGRGCDDADVQATLLECSARSIATALIQHQPDTREVLVCGGGVHNAALMQRLAALLPDASVRDTQAIGIDPDFVEAIGFAWLARQTLLQRAGNLPEVTGARGPRVLGSIHPA